MHNSVAIFFSRVGIPLAMGLFIDCHFLTFNCCASVNIFKFCHMKIFDVAVDAENGVPSGEIGTFPTYSSL